MPRNLAGSILSSPAPSISHRWMNRPRATFTMSCHPRTAEPLTTLSGCTKFEPTCVGTEGVAQERGEASGVTGQVSLLDSFAGSSRGQPPSRALALV